MINPLFLEATSMTESSEVKAEDRDSEKDENTDEELRVQVRCR